MQTAANSLDQPPPDRALHAEQWRALLTEKDQVLAEKEALLAKQEALLAEQEDRLLEHEKYIRLLEEYLRLAKAQKFGTSSEKVAFQIDLFDEAELTTALHALQQQLPDADLIQPRTKQSRQRGFATDLPRVRIDLLLSEDERAGARGTFFTKVKEELEFIPAKLQVLEYWQEKAVFAVEDGGDRVVAAQRPTHPLGKCMASTSLLAHIVTAKYADGLPLYRQEGILQRFGAQISRTNMAQWIVRLGMVLQPLLALIRAVQNSGDYLQADETRLQVLKEPGKTAQAQKWMWVVRGGPPGRPSVLFDYDPSRAGCVPERLLEGFRGVLQADGYSGYGLVCQGLGITRIGCMDHARRKFVEAVKAADTGNGKKSKGPPSKAEVALGKIRKLYAIEAKVQGMDDAARLAARQQFAVPMLEELKVWLDRNLPLVPKGSHTHKAIQYTLNQWDYLIGYCAHGKLHISNALAENAIRPFAVGRKAWLFADTPQGARASAACYSLIETAKANQLEPYAYLRYVLDRIGDADAPEKLEPLLPWNVPLESLEKNGKVFDGVNMSI